MENRRFTISFILVVVAVSGVILQLYKPVDHGREVQTPTSLGFSGFEKVDDYPLYVLHFEGDYGFSEYLRTGYLNASFSDGSSPSCTCFTATEESGEHVFGRNFDFPMNPTLLLFTDPPDGYASVSLVDLGYFGYSMSHLPDPEEGFKSLLMAPYLPFDGMNEHGLVVGMAAIPHAEPPYDPDKATIGEIQVIRLLLDRAMNVDEAVELLKKYNIEMTDPPIHYLLADRLGSSAIIEFIDGEMKILRSDESWQVITNFIIHGSGAPDIVSCSRYRSTYDGLSVAEGCVSIEDAMNLLKRASQSSTIWSVVYSMETGEVHIAMGRKYGHILIFKSRTYSTSTG